MKLAQVTTGASTSSVRAGDSVAVLIVGALRGFFVNGTWATWAHHVVAPLRAAAYSVDTFLCTTSPIDSALPANLHALGVRKWIRTDSAAELGLRHFDCTLRSMGCRGALTAVWQRHSRHRRLPPEHAPPAGFLSWLRNHTGDSHEFIALHAFPWPKDYLALGCARMATMGARSSNCFEVATRHAQLSGGGAYDWYMLGRPDMAWYAPPPLPSTLRPDAVSLRARELWGGEAGNDAFVLGDEHMSFLWGTRECTGAACSRRARAPCLLVDDAWAWVPSPHARIYFAAACDGGTALATKSPLPPPHDASLRTKIGAASPPWRISANWSAAALQMMYNGEGLLTARLLQARVPIDVVPASLRFFPPKSVYYWAAQKRCADRPCATLTQKRCSK
jgi:hypothetical protein